MEESTLIKAESEPDSKPSETTEEKKPKAKKKTYKKSGKQQQQQHETDKTPVSTHRGMATGIEEHTFITGPNMEKQWMTSRKDLLAWATKTYGNNVKKSFMNLKHTGAAGNENFARTNHNYFFKEKVNSQKYGACSMTLFGGLSKVFE